MLVDVSPPSVSDPASIHAPSSLLYVIEFRMCALQLELPE
jgi:hypothetical protein